MNCKLISIDGLTKEMDMPSFQSAIHMAWIPPLAFNWAEKNSSAVFADKIKHRVYRHVRTETIHIYKEEHEK